MKKCLSVLLCLIMLVSGIMCFSVSASAEEDYYPRVAISDSTRNQDFYVGDTVEIVILYEQLWKQ